MEMRGAVRRHYSVLAGLVGVPTHPLLGKEFRLCRNLPVVSDTIISCTGPVGLLDLANVPVARPSPWCCQAMIRASPSAMLKLQKFCMFCLSLKKTNKLPPLVPGV